ncbi:MAG: helix-turn-helix domain-containing protein [Gemmatimonadetes bacterium]|nr:helix-turn-helix domain-containing protein [Gemmatimonadota bacterium]
MLDFTDPHLLRTDEEYEAAVAEVDALLDADPQTGTREFDRLEFLSVLIEAYEDAHEPPSGADVTPQAVVDFMLEQKGLTRADLAEAMGGKSRVSEFFSGKRDLSREQIKALREILGIPADLLLR